MTQYLLLLTVHYYLKQPPQQKERKRKGKTNQMRLFLFFQVECSLQPIIHWAAPAYQLQLNHVLWSSQGSLVFYPLAPPELWCQNKAIYPSYLEVYKCLSGLRKGSKYQRQNKTHYPKSLLDVTWSQKIFFNF